MDLKKTSFSSQTRLACLQQSREYALFNFQSLKFVPHAIQDALRQFYAFRQGQNMTCSAYLKEFTNNVDVVAYCGGTIGMSPALFLGLATETNFNQAAATDADRLKVSVAARERYLATAFLTGSDRRRYDGLMREIENGFLRGTDMYPKTMTAAFNLLVNWKEDANKTRRIVSDGVAFPNDGVTLATPGRPRRDISTVECHNCGELGHYSSDCTKPRRQTAEQLLMSGMESGEFDDEASHTGFTFVNDAAYHPSTGITLNASHGSRIPKTWLLLDNQSTVDVSHNPDLLERIRISDDGHMDIHCNAGVTSTNLVGDLPGYGTVWYHPKGIANILLLNRVKAKYHVTYDSTNGNAFTVHKEGDRRTCSITTWQNCCFYVRGHTNGSSVLMY
jgi:Zinc knuckle